MLLVYHRCRSGQECNAGRAWNWACDVVECEASIERRLLGEASIDRHLPLRLLFCRYLRAVAAVCDRGGASKCVRNTSGGVKSKPRL